MSTIIRDINGNRTSHGLRHYSSNCAETSEWHRDSTGLFCIDYCAGTQAFCAFIRPESAAERNAVAVARRIGRERQ